MSEWQPIATAPRDGTSILTYPHYAVTSWVSEDVYPGPGWSDGWDEGIERWKTTDKPTHWMPLPKSPHAECAIT